MGGRVPRVARATTCSATPSRDIYRLSELFREAGTKPEYEVYDVGHLYNLHHLAEQGLVDFPFHVQFVLGVLGANAATIEQLVHMRRTAIDAVRGRELHLVGGRRRLPGRVPPRRDRADAWAGTCGSGWRTTCVSTLRPPRGVERRARGEGA